MKSVCEPLRQENRCWRMCRLISRSLWCQSPLVLPPLRPETSKFFLKKKLGLDSSANRCENETRIFISCNSCINGNVPPVRNSAGRRPIHTTYFLDFARTGHHTSSCGSYMAKLNVDPGAQLSDFGVQVSYATSRYAQRFKNSLNDDN